jgi:hypothetical protein
MIEHPAMAAGVTFEPGLVDRILSDGDKLPPALYQFALRELWEMRRQGYLTHDAYESLGGVQAQLARRAEDTFSLLSPDDQAVARSVLLRLVELTDGGPVVRRRVVLDELVGGKASSASVSLVIESFLGAGLLASASDEFGKRAVTLAHEVVIHSWPRLAGWIDGARATLQARQDVARAAGLWAAEGYDHIYLMPAQRLKGMPIGDPDLALNSLENAYVAEVYRRDRRRLTFRNARWTTVLVTGIIVAVVSFGAGASNLSAFTSTTFAVVGISAALLQLLGFISDQALDSGGRKYSGKGS